MDSLSRWEDNQLWAEEKRRDGEELEEWCNSCHQVYRWIDGGEAEYVWDCKCQKDCQFMGCPTCFQKHEEGI